MWMSVPGSKGLGGHPGGCLSHLPGTALPQSSLAGLPPLHLALCFGRNNPTTAPPGLQSRADVAGLEGQLVASRGHRDWAVSGPSRANPRAGRAVETRTQVPKPKGQSHA